MEYKSKYEKYECLKITEQERDALELYISSRHIDINSMLELSPSVIAKQERKGWYINLSMENVIANLDNIHKIYSAMYKYSIANPNRTFSRLSRGTTLDEVKHLRTSGTYEKFLSTSTDAEVAMRFTEYQNGAMITLNIADNVPYIPMDEFLGETQISESEVLISPFTTIKDIQEHYHAEGEVGRFTTSVTKKEFKELSDEERDSLLSKLKKINIPEYVKRLSALEDRIDILNSRKNNTSMDAQDKKELTENLNNLQNEYTTLMAEFKEARRAIHSLIQDRLRQVELNIDRDIAKEEQEKSEIQRKTEIERIEKAKASIKERIDQLLTKIDAISKGYFSTTKEQEDMTKLAKDNGIVISDEEKYGYEVEQKFSSLKSNSEKIRTLIENINVPVDATIEDLRECKYDDLINESFASIEMVETLIPEMEQCISKEKQDLMQGIRVRLNAKITEDVKRRLQSKLQEKKDVLENSKTSIWDRITGKAKLREEEIKNLTLRSQSVNGIKISIPENSQDIKKYITNLYNIIDGNEGEVLTSEAQKVKGIVSDRLLVLGSNRMSARKKAKMLHEENKGIIIASENGDTSYKDGLVLPTSSDLTSILDNAIFYTGDSKDIKEPKEMQKTLGGF